MLKLIIEDDEGRKTVVPFVRDEITIGRQEGNTIRLTERNVSRRHARLLRQNGHVVVEDLGSYNGIRINGEKIATPSKVRSGDLIQIGDYDLAIQDEAPAHPPAPPVLAPAAALNGSNGTNGAHAANGLHAEGDEDTARSRREALEDAELESATPVAEAAEAAVDAGGTAERSGSRQSTAVIRIDQLEASARHPVEEIDAAEAPRLVVMNTDFAGREYACIRTELRLGRTEENDIQIDHRSMSRSHAKLQRDRKGEWKVVDLQSANGIRINGEAYGQAALASGDVLELGHVKLKFLSPGERFVPERAGGARKGLGLYIGAAVAALVLLAGTAAWVLTRPATPKISVANDPVAPPTVPPDATAAANPTPPTPTPPTRPAEGTTVAAAARSSESEQLAAKAKQAREQMAARDFDGALETLDTLQKPDGTYPDEISDLVDEAQAEATSKKNLEQAEQLLEAGRLDEALSLLGQAQGTTAFTREYDRLKSRADTMAAREARKPKPQVKPAPGANPADAQKYLEEGTALLKKRQFAQARDALTRCLKADKSLARCHMYLGSAFAKLRDIDNAERHYRAFVEMAPEDPLAPRIREFLTEHDQQKR